MKYEFAIITTEGETHMSLPIALSKIEEVAGGSGNFSCAQDTEIAKWMLQVAKILTLR